MLKRHPIGIMGGTFDPIHIGHLVLAQAAYETLGLEKVVFIPAGRPPHKKDRKEQVSNECRAEMVRLAIEDDDRFELDMREIYKQSYCYTVETIKELSLENPENKYYFIIGGDSLRDFHTWREPGEIVKYCSIAASYRPGITQEMDELLEENRRKYNGEFVKIPVPMLDISSHEIRKRIGENKTYRYYVPEKVYQLIKADKLYIE